MMCDCDNAGSGFRNLYAVPDEVLEAAQASGDFGSAILAWIAEHPETTCEPCVCGGQFGEKGGPSL